MQVELVKGGKPYVLFGDGTLAACKPISESDLAAFIADCVQGEDRVNQVLPIGGGSSVDVRCMTTMRKCKLIGAELLRECYATCVPYWQGPVAPFASASWRRFCCTARRQIAL